MKRLRIRTWQADALLLAVTAVWGATFPVVKNATDLLHGGVPTYWFLAARFTLATVLVGLFFWRRVKAAPLRTWAAGALIGCFLFAGYAFQTFGIAHTTSARAGFITGLSVVLVPALTVIWLRRKPSPGAWLGVLTATAGLALLSLNADLMPTYGDFLVFLCAIAFALQIIAISRFAGQHDPVALAVIQIGVAAVLSWGMHLREAGTVGPGVAGVLWWSGPASVTAAWLICGVLATAVAFLLQNVLQPHTTPTHTALIFAAEPVWGAIFSFLLLGETLPLRGYVGGAMILAGMLLAELPLWGARPDADAVAGQPGD
ncbi:MAG: permease of drug/metabolite transporter superfamily [Firmicutes bacterium]|nr:permease of drug/metabolite transporter superfamily [Bacillota bacterium]